jgi:hypothetical protein
MAAFELGGATGTELRLVAGQTLAVRDYVVEVSLADGTDTETITVGVTRGPSQPATSFTATEVTGLTAAATAGTVFANLSLTDPGGGAHGLVLSGTDAGLFELNSAGTQLQLAAGQTVSGGTYTVIISTATGVSPAVTDTLTLTVDNSDPTIAFGTAPTAGATPETATVMEGTAVTAGTPVTTPATVTSGNFFIADIDTGDTLSLRADTGFTANAATDPTNVTFTTTAYAAVTSGTAIEGQYGSFTITVTDNSNISVTYALGATGGQTTNIDALTADSVEEIVIYAYDGAEESATAIEYQVTVDIA